MKYRLLRLWRRLFPLPMWCNECCGCWGTGGHGSMYDPSPSGVSLSPGYMYDWDPCEYCANEGICTSCGTQLNEYDAERLFCNEGTCPFCRFTLKDARQPEPDDYVDDFWYEDERDWENAL